MSERASGRNRLGDEQSPYLRQHADNPVHWQPWDEQALAEARERDVPIFLSVGYSACHWCHVMANESFEDERVADRLNESFVPIKVDREERPDLDSIYMTVAQLVTGGGGWPLSVWLTPEGKPFYVGTYFPPEPRRGQPGFLELLENIAHSWEHDRDELEERAEQWTAALEGELEETPEQPGDAPGDDLLKTAAGYAVRGADRDYGGFGRGGPKFPQTSRIDLLLRAYDRTGAPAQRAVAFEALDAMANGGLYDHVGGGFHRYATDRKWRVPHFEKMLYDNALLPPLYLAGYQLTGSERYAEIARESFAFVERELTHPDGGFYSTLDAQSEGEEGRFYVWTPEAVHDAVADETAADVFCDRFGVTQAGNFEGHTVLSVRESLEELAESYDRSPDEVERLLATATEQAFAAREDRTRPNRDEKVLAGWNGLMISALAEGAFVLDDERYAEQARDALSFVESELWDGETLSRRFKDGDVRVDGYLEDYAFLARGALDLYQATGEVEHLAFALSLARGIVSEFWDESAGTLYYTPVSGESLVTRPQELSDQSVPSSTGVAVSTLLSLSHFVPHDEFADVAERVVETHAGTIESNPLQHAGLAIAADELAGGALELTVVADELPGSWHDRFAARYLPNRLLTRRPPTDDELTAWLDELDLDEPGPIWANREQKDGEPTLYVCRSFTCSPPVTDVEEAFEWLEDLRP